TVNCPNNPPNCVARVAPESCTMTFPGQSNVYVISVNGSACAVLDGSGTTDSSGNPLHFTWTEGTNVVGTSAVVTNCMSLGCHTFKLTVSNGSDSCSTILTVCAISPCEAVEQCIALVDGANVSRKN